MAIEARQQGFSDVMFLDLFTHTKIEEVGAANFCGITKAGQFVTPKSPSIFPGVTRDASMFLAQNRLSMEVEMGDVYVDQLDRFVEASASGTAAVITPIGTITHQGQWHAFYSDTKIGPVIQKLYNELISIQLGDKEAPEGWIQLVHLPR